MPAEVQSPPIMKRIRRNIMAGRKARKELGAKLAEMPIAQAAKLPRALLARIAPDAMAVLARAGAETDDLLPAGASGAAAAPPVADKRLIPLWLTIFVWVLLAIEAALIAGTLERPAHWAIVRVGLASPETAGLCARLDRWTDRCSYTLGHSEITLEDIAARLTISVEQLSAANPVLPQSEPLPSHTKIRVDRETRRY